MPDNRPSRFSNTPLGGQHAPCRAFDGAEAPAALDHAAVLGLRRPAEPGIESFQRQRDGRQAGDHAGLADDDGRPAHGLRRDQGVGGPITLAAEVLADRQFQQPPPIVLKLGVPGDLMEFFGHGRGLRRIVGQDVGASVGAAFPSGIHHNKFLLRKHL